MRTSTSHRRGARRARRVLTVLFAALLSLPALAALPAAASTTPLPNNCVDQTYFVFYYDNGQVDSGCAPSNDVFPGTPGTDITVASKLHVSCSDTITGGRPVKSIIPAGVLITDWSIIKKDGKTCGSPIVPPPPSVNVSIDKTVNGGLKTTTAAVGEVVTFTLKVSAATGEAKNVVVTDTLPAGFEYVSSNGAVCTQSGQVLTCDLGTLGSPALPGPNPCVVGSEKYYVFEYNDSNVVGIDKGCGTKNDIVTPIAPKLHISCSDKFPGGVPEKSDLGDPNRRVVAWYITDGKKKTCGNGTFTPPRPAEVTITIKAKVMDSGCNVGKVSSTNDSSTADNESQACVTIPPPPETGYLEICAEAPSGTFTYRLSNGTTVSVPAGACSPAMEVPSGPITIVQNPKDCFALTDITAFPAARFISKNLSTRTGVVRIVTGGVQNQTIATFTNVAVDCPPPPTGQHKVCATSLTSVPTGTLFKGTANGASFSVRVGYCTLAGQFPSGTRVTSVLAAKAGYEVSGISALPADRLVSANPATRTAVVRIGFGVTETVFDITATSPY